MDVLDVLGNVMRCVMTDKKRSSLFYLFLYSIYEGKYILIFFIYFCIILIPNTLHIETQK